MSREKGSGEENFFYGRRSREMRYWLPCHNDIPILRPSESSRYTPPVWLIHTAFGFRTQRHQLTEATGAR